MNISGVEVWIILALFTRYVLGAWDTAYSPLYPDAFLKLSNDELIRISNNKTYSYGDSISELIDPPTTGNYSITIANGDLYAIYEGTEKTNKSMSISHYNTDSGKWKSISYKTTLSKNTNYEYFQDSTVMTSPGDSKDSIYIYGGLYNKTVSNRILQFDTKQNTLNSVITSVSPTGFYGSSNAILDADGTSNLLIGGKASSGWVSMFQCALWEYKSWTFKTVSSSSKSINSRINSLALSVFKGDETDASSVLVFGGMLGSNMASPYVLSLNLTDDWKWNDVSKKTDINVGNLLGAVIFNSTLFTITKSSSKRNSGYSLSLFDTETLGKVDSFDSFYVDPGTVSSSISSTASKSQSVASSASSESQSSSSAVSESSESATSEAASSESSESSSIAQLTSSVQSSASESASAAVSSTSKTSNAKVIVPAVIVPIVSISLISVLVFVLYKKYSGKSKADQDSISDSDSEPDFTKEMNQIDNQSISSWNQKRDEYERRRYSQQRTPTRQAQRSPTRPTPQRSPTRQSVTDFTFDNTNIGKRLKRLSTQMSQKQQTTPIIPTRAHGPFANPEDYADKQELSPMSNYTNKSRLSLISSKGDTNSTRSDDDELLEVPDEEAQIDQFLGNRDVQVLVSSKRRSKLRITNPDIESLDCISEAGSGSTFYDEKRLNDSASKFHNVFEDNGSSSLLYDNDNNNDDDDENQNYVREILKAFDRDDLSTDIGSFDKYEHY